MKFKRILITGVALLGLVGVSGISNANASHYGWWQTKSERRAHNNWVSGQVKWAKSHGYMKRSHRHHHRKNRYHNHYDHYFKGAYDKYITTSTGFRRTNNKHALKRAAFQYSDKKSNELDGHPVIFNRYSPFNHKACIPLHFHIKRNTEWYNGSNRVRDWQYKGNGIWRARYY